MKTRSNIRDLSAACIDSKPVNYDWSEGYPEKWDYYACERREAYRDDPAMIVESWNNETDQSVDGPMMNYYYPLAGDGPGKEELAHRIIDLPLCVVHFDDDTFALALTGGGMDLSWEICEAFMLCGYLPPVHFCDLPVMGGRGTSSRDRWIIAGCRRSLQIAKSRAGYALRRLRVNFTTRGVAVCD